MNSKKLDIICISEANVMKGDDMGDVGITGFNLVTDKLLTKYGRARSAIYLKEDLKYHVRADLMDEEEPEIWIEIHGG